MEDTYDPGESSSCGDAYLDLHSVSQQPPSQVDTPSCVVLRFDS